MAIARAAPLMLRGQRSRHQPRPKSLIEEFDSTLNLRSSALAATHESMAYAFARLPVR
ncbi:Uncharacterised protein [Vibrio cholerae]|nr:Uncharacterised protein [Vibrio cholerae]CSH91816.1 Uncharacterised protein [Vibrio cholerae]